MLIIRHRSGPLTGKEEMPTGRRPDRIVFGRDPDVCDVVYPPDAPIVARRHFALVRTLSGDWTIELFGTPFVAINGEPADAAAAVRTGMVVELGRRGGPSFEVIVTKEGTASNLAMTLPQEQFVGAHAAADHADRSATRALWVGRAGVMLAVTLAVAGGSYWFVRHQSDRKFQDELQALNDFQARLAADSIPRRYRDDLAKAAFLVVQRDASGHELGVASAFPIGPNLLATAAHVAAERDDLVKGDGEMLVRSPGVGAERRTWKVVWHKLHPAYNLLNEFLSKDPLAMPSAGNDGNPSNLRFLTSGNGYDVALIRVEGEPLSPILELATQDEISKLAQGDPLAYAGYPQQDVAGAELLVLSASPEVRTGSLTSLTDLFSMPTAPPHRQLVHHNMGTTVGTSGSPIISTSGHVVALHNRSSYIRLADGKSVPSGALINYGQRIDLLKDLISGDADNKLADERRFWDEQTRSLKRGFEAISAKLLENLKPSPSATAEVLSQQEFKFEDKDYKITSPGKDNGGIVRRRQVHSIKLKQGEQHVFLAYGREQTKLGLYLFVDDKSVQQVDPNSWYPVLAYTAPNDATIYVHVIGPDEDIGYSFVDYIWRTPKF